METSGKATKAYGTAYAKVINWVLKVFHHNLNIQRKTGKKMATGYQSNRRIKSEQPIVLFWT